MGKKNAWLTGLLVSSSLSAHADLPLTLEDVITEKGKVKMDLSISYANSNRQGVSVGERQANSDSVVGTVGLQYGLTAKAEIFGRTSYLYSNTRSSDVTGISTTRNHRFADAWVGQAQDFKRTSSDLLLGASTAFRRRALLTSPSYRMFQVQMGQT